MLHLPRPPSAGRAAAQGVQTGEPAGRPGAGVTAPERPTRPVPCGSPHAQRGPGHAPPGTGATCPLTHSEPEGPTEHDEVGGGALPPWQEPEGSGSGLGPRSRAAQVGFLPEEARPGPQWEAVCWAHPGRHWLSQGEPQGAGCWAVPCPRDACKGSEDSALGKGRGLGCSWNGRWSGPEITSSKGRRM